MTTLKLKTDYMDIEEIVEIISYLNNLLQRKISEKKIKDEQSKKRLPINRKATKLNALEEVINKLAD